MRRELPMRGPSAAMAAAALAATLGAACDAFEVDQQSDAAPPSGPTGKLLAPDPAQGDEFGGAVAISGDTLAVGAPGFDPVLGGGEEGGEATGVDDAGAVLVFRRSGDSFSVEATLTAPDARAGDRFGSSVSLDGNVLIVGAPGADDGSDGAGAAYVFERSGTEWTPLSIPN